MQVDPAIRERLLENNPFSFSAAGDPRENEYPDVEGVDQAVTRSIMQLIEQKQKNPGTPRAAAVLGETGSGKTHMIGRLIRAGSKGKPPFSFAYIRPFIDPNRGFRYLLKEIVSNLNSKSFVRDEYSQIEYVCGKILTHVLIEAARRSSDKKVENIAKACQENPVKALELQMQPKTRNAVFRFTKKFLKESHDELNASFLHVLLQYFFYEEKRSAARRWLMGKAIDQEDCKILEVQDYRSKQTPEALEDEAHQILLSLDLILDHYGDRPLIVFFDQLENLTTKEQLEKFNQLLWFFSDRTRTMMPIAFFRGDEWADNFKVCLDNPVITRLEGNMFWLKGCTQDQARSIIESRLDMALSGIQRPDPLYPFSLNAKELNRVIDHRVKSPRQVINRANQLLFSIIVEDIEVIPPHQVLATTFSNKIAKILANFDQFEPDEGRLTLALQLYLSNRPDDAGYSLEQLEKSAEKIKYIDLTGRLCTADVFPCQAAFLIDVALHHKAVGASLRSGIAFMKKHGTSRVIFIRDMRCPFPELPKWPSTNQQLQALEEAGGFRISLDKEAAAHWYALALLKFDVTAGDVCLNDGTSITIDQFNAFIRDCLNGNDSPAFAQRDEYLKTIPASSDKNTDKAPVDHLPKDIVWMAGEVLKQVPVRMLKADLLVNKVSEKYPISTDNLLLLLEDHHEQFTLIRAMDHTIIKLK